MVDSVISPSSNYQWTIYEKPNEKKLGIVQHTNKGFVVLANRDNLLTGISLGPYASKEAAMKAIGARLGGVLHNRDMNGGTEAPPPHAADPAVTQRTLQTIEWNAYPLQIPPANERLLLILSAAGHPPRLKLIGKSEVAIGYWAGDTFRVMSGFLRPQPMSSDWQPAVTHWARLVPCLPQGLDLLRDRRLDPDVGIPPRGD